MLGVSDLHSTAHARLHADGQRYTARRRALVDELERSDRPLSIPELLDNRRDLAQSSAYRNLSVLERSGVVRRIVTQDDFARYELAEDLTEHHHHLVCSRCGNVEDFTVSDELEQELDRALRRAASTHGFAATSHQLDILGTCDRCG